MADKKNNPPEKEKGAEQQISNSHDTFFRYIFSDKDTVAHYITSTLPAGIVGNLDTGQLEIDNTAYVSSQLETSFADIVYNCPNKKGGHSKIVFLLEHKSFTTDFPHLQILRYMINIWEYHTRNPPPTNQGQRNKHKKLQMIVPIVIYHGKSNWTKKPFRDYFDDVAQEAAFREYLPEFDYWLTNLNKSNDWEIKKTYKLLKLRTALLVMKHIFDKETTSWLPEVLEVITRISPNEQSLFNYYEAILLYLGNFRKDQHQQIKDTMRNFVNPKDWPALEGSIMWQIKQEERLEGIQEGMQKGIQEGMQEGMEAQKLQTIKVGIESNLDNAFIAKLAGATIEEVEKVRHQLNKGRG